MRRVSIYADFRFRARRQDVLATFSSEGQQCFTAMMVALEQRKVSRGERLEATVSLLRKVDDSYKVAALNFFAEPAQKTLIEKIELGSLKSFTHVTKNSAKQSCALEELLSDDVGRLAWGAFSLKKVKQPQLLAIEKPKRSDSKRTCPKDQLNLEDLSIISCAGRYLNRHFDYSFMKQLSTNGANIVHRIAMILATDYGTRIDLAIITAAKVLTDPIVGGDAGHCYCMLKARQFPESWASLYGLD